MALRLVLLGFILVLHFLSLKGEILNLKPDDSGVLDALDFAMNEFNYMGNNFYRYMSTKIEDATMQVKTQLCLD